MQDRHVKAEATSQALQGAHDGAIEASKVAAKKRVADDERLLGILERQD